MKKSLSRIFTTISAVLLMLLVLLTPMTSQDTFTVLDPGVESIDVANEDIQIQQISMQSISGDTAGDITALQNYNSGEEDIIEDPDIPPIEDPFNQGSRNSLQWWWIAVLLIVLIGNSIFFFFLLSKRKINEGEKKKARRDTFY